MVTVIGVCALVYLAVLTVMGYVLTDRLGAGLRVWGRCQVSDWPASWRPRPRGRRRRLRPPATPTSARPVTRPLLAPPSVRLEADDTHARRGFGCVDCHGGNAAATDARRPMIRHADIARCPGVPPSLRRALVATPTGAS